jgi:hypothetical protein
MTSWDIERTRKLVTQVYGPQQVELIRPSLEALAERQVFASYHFHEYKNILDKHIDSRLGERHILELTLPLHTTDQYRIDNALNQAAANAIACLQSLHCLLDTLAHVIYYCSGLNLTSDFLSERDISSNRVVLKLRSRPDFSSALNAFDGISSHQHVKHLSALVNHSKHRSVIRPSLNVDLRNTSEPTYALEFPAFTYNKKTYRAVDAERFMEQVYEVLSPKVVECGSLLNDVLETNVGTSGAGLES